MVDKSFQTEILLELVFSVSHEKSERLILDKSLPLYLRKLNCFIAGVLKIEEESRIKELMIVPFAAGKTNDWDKVKTYFSSVSMEDGGKPTQFTYNSVYYYGLCLNGYGLLILGRKKPFTFLFLKELENVVHHLGKALIQSNEIEKRQLAEKNLIVSEQRLMKFLQESPSDIEVYDSRGLQVVVNKAYEEFWGIPSSKTLLNFNILKCEAIKGMELFKYVNKAYEGEAVSIEDYKFCPENNVSNVYEGVERWMSTRIYPLISQNDELTHIVVTHDDVTHRKEAEVKLREAKEKAEESDRLKTAFLSNMSHEIRTPMNGILGFAELLKQSTFDEEDRELSIELIEKSSARMLSIIDDLVNISKLESGQMELYISETNVNTQIQNVRNLLSDKIKSKNLELKIKSSLSNNDCFVKTDREKLYLVLRNLTENAIKYSKHGVIEIIVDKKEGFFKFSVKDEGIGIPLKKQSAIFDRFIQADIGDKRAFQGAGLGLAISKAFVEMLGGEIWIESKEGIGSKFYFTIPCNVDFKEKNLLKNSITN
ncbi:PAS domain-containing sensor histidine kinase [Ancylomarina sp. 16SWW S1-10-2]|uniref:PAS domain-containing sensor histidine kinase n=1 Tax=Ancylomarina sp. 16SWW S1-10-2 TaxID=2499681 RepID=UPI0012ADBC32|nr:PAS domain-containing sensor histidine kinase [Ancylomarina sp. 16SWW S1-10-2]MRT92800.1 PAS domain-containing sensor histidine kinase [Ancylomarina sp. 16SWW S1-10-2]